MKHYKITGNSKQDIGKTAENYSHPLATGLSSRSAADRTVEALASQGAWNLVVESYADDDDNE